MEPWHFRIKAYKMFKNLIDLCNTELKLKIEEVKSKKLDEKSKRATRASKRTKSLDEQFIQKSEGIGKNLKTTSDS